MSKHTPGKWKVIGCGEPGCWCRVIVNEKIMPDDFGAVVVSAGSVNAADAERIVRCVNSHDDLLAALKDLERTAGQAAMFDDPVRVAARAAIARAEGREA